MKRILVAAALAFGMLFGGATSASASTLCTIDPTVGIGLPVHYSLNVSVLGTHVYASGTSRTTTFGGVVGI
jgi:hypothetical protein